MLGIINPNEIKKALGKNLNIEAVFLTHNETSTGTKTDIKAIAEIIKNYPNLKVFVLFYKIIKRKIKIIK